MWQKSEDLSVETSAGLDNRDEAGLGWRAGPGEFGKVAGGRAGLGREDLLWMSEKLSAYETCWVVSLLEVDLGLRLTSWVWACCGGDADWDSCRRLFILRSGPRERVRWCDKPAASRIKTTTGQAHTPDA